MDRLTPEIEKAYRNWRRSLAGRRSVVANDVAVARFIRSIGPRAMTPEHKEKIRRAQLKRWAKKRAA